MSQPPARSTGPLGFGGSKQQGTSAVLGLAGANAAETLVQVRALRDDCAVLREQTLALTVTVALATQACAEAQAEIERLQATPLYYAVQVLSFNRARESIAKPTPFQLASAHHDRGPFTQVRIARTYQIPAPTLEGLTNVQVLAEAAERVEREGAWPAEDEQERPTFVWSLLSRRPGAEARDYESVASTDGTFGRKNNQLVARDDELFLYLRKGA